MLGSGGGQRTPVIFPARGLDQQLERLAGADRFLLKEETCDGNLYARLHTGQQLSPRIIALSTLKSLGFETGGGVIVGTFL